MGIVSGSRNPKVIVRIFYLYHVTLKLKVIDLERDRVYCPWPSLSRSRSGSTAFIYWFSNSLTKKHRYRHQDYISSMFLAKDTKNDVNSALGPFKFCAARGRGTWEPTWKMCSNVSEVCRVSYMETFCEKKIREKLTGENYRGGVATTPPLAV